MQKVFLFCKDGNECLGFDTGLDSRAFAQAKFSHFVTEPGFIVSPGCTGKKVNFWNASGVAESDDGKTMVIWGQPFPGKPLALIASDADQRGEALSAIAAWIKALLCLGESDHIIKNALPFQPVDVLIEESGAGEKQVFFVPPNLARRCMRDNCGWYTHPDLDGFELAAFAAAAMLYRVFAAAVPYPQAEEIVLRQDIREGNFLPVKLAAPCLDEKIALLIQNALQPRDGKNTSAWGTDVLRQLLSALQPGGITAAAEHFFKPVSEDALLSLEKEKAQYLKIKAASVKTRRFVKRNTVMLAGSFAAAAAVALIIFSVASSRAMRPTTAGMSPVQVIETYYNAMGDLDHQLMEACVMRKAGKNDISTVVNLFVINKTRQAYDMYAPPLLVSAREWQEMGSGEVDFGVFGVTDLQIKDQLARGNEHDSEIVRYQANYTLWVPAQMADESDAEPDPDVYRPPQPYHYSDMVTLTLHKGNWRIAEIIRSAADKSCLK